MDWLSNVNDLLNNPTVVGMLGVNKPATPPVAPAPVTPTQPVINVQSAPPVPTDWRKIGMYGGIFVAALVGIFLVIRKKKK